GDLVSALMATDTVLGQSAGPDDPEVPEAIRLAAVAHASGGNLARAAELYAYLGADRLGNAAADAVVACIGIGDRDTAKAYAAGAAARAPTSTAAGLELMVRGVCDSVDGDGSAALRTMMRAVSTLLPV